MTSSTPAKPATCADSSADDTNAPVPTRSAWSRRCIGVKASSSTSHLVCPAPRRCRRASGHSSGPTGARVTATVNGTCTGGVPSTSRSPDERVNVFEIRDRLVGDYRSFTSAFVEPRDVRIRELLDRRLAEGARRLRVAAAAGHRHLASRLFGSEVTPARVIGETLVLVQQSPAAARRTAATCASQTSRSTPREPWKR